MACVHAYTCIHKGRQRGSCCIHAHTCMHAMTALTALTCYEEDIMCTHAYSLAMRRAACACAPLMCMCTTHVHVHHSCARALACHACMHACSLAMHVCMHAHLPCMYACMCMCTHLHACMHACSLACGGHGAQERREESPSGYIVSDGDGAQQRAWVHACMYVRMHVCMYVCRQRRRWSSATRLGEGAWVRVVG